MFNEALADSPLPSTPPQPLLLLVENPSLSSLEPPPAARAVRRLALEDLNATESQRPPSPARAQSPVVEESPPPSDGPSSSPLPAQYPTPPAAPRKDQYVQDSGSDSECSELYDKTRAPPAYIFRDGRLMFHRKYQGRRPFTFVDTGLYEGGRHDWYGVHTDRDLIWANRLELVLQRHNIQRKAPPACSRWQSGAGRS